MTISTVDLTDTFNVWRTRFNQVVLVTNNSTEGQMNTSGTITISNPTYLNSNVSLNVSNGVIRVKGNTFDANAITFASNSPTLTIAGTGHLGSTIYLNVGALSTNINDSNTGNIASANSVYTVNRNLSNTSNIAIGAFGQANLSYTQGNTGYNQANSAITIGSAAFNKANAALANASGTFAGNLTITGTLNVSTALYATGTASLARANVASLVLNPSPDPITWDTSAGQIASVTLTASRTMAAPTNLRVGTYILHVIQGGSGSYYIAWNSVFKWPGGVAPSFSTAVGRRDIFSFVSDGTNLYGTYINDVR